MTRETQQRPKQLTMTSYQQIVTSLAFFQFMDNLEQFGSWIRKNDLICGNFIFIKINTFCLTKTENRAKKSLTQLSHYCFEYKHYTIFAKKNLKKKKKLASTKKGTKEVLVYFLKLHMCVYLRTKFKVSSIILTSFRQWSNFTSPLQNKPLKSLPRLGTKTDPHIAVKIFERSNLPFSVHFLMNRLKRFKRCLNIWVLL